MHENGEKFSNSDLESTDSRDVLGIFIPNFKCAEPEGCSQPEDSETRSFKKWKKKSYVFELFNFVIVFVMNRDAVISNSH